MAFRLDTAAGPGPMENSGSTHLEELGLKNLTITPAIDLDQEDALLEGGGHKTPKPRPPKMADNTRKSTRIAQVNSITPKGLPLWCRDCLLGPI